MFELSTEYKAYIASPAWDRKKALYYAVFGKKCQACGSRTKLHVHHKSYDNFRNEDLADLVSLCHRCHLEVHRLHRKRRGSLRAATDFYLLKHRKR